MRFNSEEADGVLVVIPPKMDLDASNAEEFKRDIVPLLEEHKNIVMDMSNVSFMDSAGLGAMLSVFKKVRSEGGTFRIFGLLGEVRDLFQLVRMQRLFEIHNDKEAAITAAQK